jgi:hypothetical protein
MLRGSYESSLCNINALSNQRDPSLLIPTPTIQGASMKRYPVFLSLFVLAAMAHSVRGQIIISEVMFNPRGSEQANEFVELYNLSATDSVSLAGWQIGERSALDEIIAHTRGLVLRPQSFAIILDPTYFQSSTQYDSLIAFEALIITIDDNTLGNGGLSNSTAETVILVNAEGDTVAQYTYSLGNSDGISDEKIELNEDDSASNWANSLRVDGTPGFTNSVTRAQIDGGLAAQSLTITPYPLRENTPAIISVLLRNAGREILSAVNVDFDLIPRGREFGSPVYLGNVASERAVTSEDTLRLHFNAPAMSPGRYNLLATLSIPNDVNAANDTVSLPIAVSWARETIVINEIMFEPASGQPEWIEIYNPQSFSVPLPDWAVEDESGAKGAITQTVFIPPKRFRVLTASKELAGLFNLPDTSVILLNKFPSLNNSGDAVLVRDFSAAVIDSITYEGEWGEAGKSIERIWFERSNTQRNWLPSRAHRGATPGAFNSVSPREYDLEINPLRFAPENPQFGEAVRLEAIIRNLGRNALANFSALFYFDPAGGQNWMPLGEVLVNRELRSEDSLLVSFEWPQPPSGKNAVLIEVKEARDLVRENDRATATLPIGYPAKSVVINEVYYDARSNELEWFELFNRSSGVVDLSTWLWQDAEASAPTSFPDTALMLAPGKFAVISPRGSVPLLESGALHIQIPKWLTLNNDEESIRVFDFNGGRQDSIRFNSNWGGESGFSLERINPNQASQDSSNWSTCVERTGATPGRQNSIFTAVLPSAASLTVSPNPFSPDEDGVDDFAIFQMNLPMAIATVDLKIYDLRGRLIRHLLKSSTTGSHVEVVWNGRDEQGEWVRTGLYIVFMQAIRAEQGVLLSAKTTVVLARAMN